jgi:hypothetical protein
MLKEKGSPVVWKYIESPAVLLKTFPKRDTALFKLSEDFKYLPFLRLPAKKYQLQPKEQVLMLGGISGPKILEADDTTEGYTPVYDRVMSERMINLWGFHLWGKIQKGDSGSPLINAQGEVIGVTVATFGVQITAIPISRDLIFSGDEEHKLCK